VQIGASSLVVLHLLPFFYSAEHTYGLRIMPNATVEWWVFMYYLCKYLDLGDTVFIVLGKKTRQLTLLHVWHHASIIPLFAYYLSTGLGAGFISTLPLLNSLVHTLMYSHYLLTSVVTIKNQWWKPLITASQMGHHAVLVVLMTLNGFIGNPDWSVQVAFWGILWGLSILGLFANFYVQQYMKGAGKKRDESEKVSKPT